ncbi:VPA1269 family protein [Alteromonas stellipolaris]|uniref:VPA1269 family protein n=1 Tax=Alteromonas stellipolaris TaxID=233316 RepID=UPI002494E2D1|nr:VPA1269 family protein [Alteromonas stellipolaris]
MLGLIRADIPGFLKNKGGVTHLSNDELIEVCLVSLSSKHSYDDGLMFFETIRERNICFAEFYNFAKNKWSSQSLINFSVQAKKEKKLFKIWKEFDDKAIGMGYGHNSAPRQKGRLFTLLYAYFFQKYSFSEISIQDIKGLRALVVAKHPLFAGERPSSEYVYVRKELYGVLAFIYVCYQSLGVDVEYKLEKEIVPEQFVKPLGRGISKSKKYEKIKNDSFSFLIQCFGEYKNTLALKNPKEINSAFKTLLNYLCFQLDIEVKTLDDFFEVVAVGWSKENRWLYYLENVHGKAVRSKALYIRDFLVWIMLENAIDMDDGYEPLLSRLETERVMRMQKKGAMGKDETPKAVIPYRVSQIAIEILNDPTYEWAKTLDFMYFKDDEGKKVFNPTLINLMALLFTLPIRGIQAQCLDSGEGDSYKFNGVDSLWVPNDGEHANYWKAKGSSNEQRGFLCRDKSLVYEAKRCKKFDENGDPIISRAYMYINTNKTADRSVSFSDNSGYTIPWHHDDVITIVQRQLKFLNDHHSVNKPSNFLNLNSKDIKQILGAEPTTVVLKIIPSRFYLFRCNLNPSYGSWNFPPTKKLLITAWNSLMLEIQNRLDNEGTDYSIVSKDKMQKFKKNIGGGNSYISYLTIHCTRVTGITRLEEVGVPINVISKFIAGHANIRTTYRYTKHSRSYVDKKVSEGQARISRNMQMSLSSDLRTASIEDAKTMAYIPDIYSTSWHTVKERAWNSNTLGICPNSGTLCDDALKDIEFVFKGIGKCLNCKYLISGKPYLISIWSHINSLMYKARRVEEAYSELQIEYKKLVKYRKIEYKTNGKSELWSTYTQNLEKIENHMESNASDENLILAEVYYGNLLFETVRNLTNTDDDFIEGLGFEDCTDFEHLNSIVESESFVPHFNRDKDLEFKRDTFVDMALVAIGEQPIFLKPLTSEEKKAAISSVAKAIEHDLKNKEGKFLGAAMKVQELAGGGKCLPI